MGSQQMFIIVIGVIIVGIGMVVAIGIFGSQNDQANRDAVAIDCLRIAVAAKGYYNRPGILGGGENSFNGITFQHCGWKTPGNENGNYRFTAVADDQVTIEGVGTSGTIVSLTVFVDSISQPVFSPS